MAKEQKEARRKPIIIVEDSKDFSDLMKFIVEDMGFEGIQFPVESEDIVGWAKKHKPVTVLMDLALRRKSGMDFIDDLKSDRATKNIPIIVITGRELGSKEVLALEIRDVKYLRKGRVEMEEIKNEIRRSAQPQKPSAAVENGK